MKKSRTKPRPIRRTKTPHWSTVKKERHENLERSSSTKSKKKVIFVRIYLIKSSLDAIIAKLQATLKDKQATIDSKDRELKLKEDKIKQMGKEKANLIF